MLTGSADLHELQDNLVGSATILFAEGRVKLFTIHVETQFNNIIFVNANMYITDPGDCQPGGMWIGDGDITVMNIPQFGNLSGTSNWEFACDGSGKFDVVMTISADSEASFDFLNLEFNVADVVIGVRYTHKKICMCHFY